MRTFFALLGRDLLVAFRTAVPLLLATLTQPLLLVVVFGNIMPRIGLVGAAFGTVMVPGLMAVAMMMAGVQGVLMPLSSDLSGAREVDERLLAPIGVRGVALGKVAAGAVHAAIAGLVSLPAMMLALHQVGGPAVSPRWGLLLPLTAACAVLSAAFGLNIGSRVQPRFAGLLFAVVVGPLMMFGCAYYPWSSLSILGPLQYLFLLNPVVFMSEAMRAAVTPDVPHMPMPLLLTGLGVFITLLAWTGARAFERRTVL